MAQRLKPALILGSGFHRHIFDDCTDNSNGKCLQDWHELIKATANSMEVDCPPKTQFPIVRWETLILQAATGGYCNSQGKRIPPARNGAKSGEGDTKRFKSPHLVEREAKKIVAKLLTEASKNYPQSPHARIPLNPHWGCVISLNFDYAWHTDLNKNGSHPPPWEDAMGSKKRQWITVLEHKRMTASVAPETLNPDGKAPRLWFPNGSILLPETIRMGLRDYGSAPEAIHLAYNRLKAWERRYVFSEMSGDSAFECIADVLIAASESGNTRHFTTGYGTKSVPMYERFPLTWVAEFLYRPLVFAGVGLTEQEIGIWWLLAQRARNIAGVNHSDRDYLRILVKSCKKEDKEIDRTEFWETHPFGIKPLYCDNWEDGWERISTGLSSGDF